MPGPADALPTAAAISESRYSRISLGAGVLTAAAAMAFVLIRWTGLPAEGRIDTDSVTRLDGTAVFAANLPLDTPWLRPLADSPSAPRRSELEFFEDGRPLGPAHASADALAVIPGAYSHTLDGTRVLFSTPDGSDPRTNGHRYSFRAPMRTSLRDAINLALLSGILLLHALAGGRMLNELRNQALRRGGDPSIERFLITVSQEPFRRILSTLTCLAWPLGGIFAVWLLFSLLSPDLAVWAPLRIRGVGVAILMAERQAPLLLLLIAFLGCLIWPKGMEGSREFRPLALVPLLFCLGYVCSIYRPEPLFGLDADPYSNFLGVLPYSDAMDYYEGARHLLDVGDLTYFTERRPANASWLAIRLSLTGSLAAATLVQVVLAGLATGYLAFVVGRIFGPWSSLGVVAFTYSYSRLYFTTNLSETSGITFGALGVALILLGLSSERTVFALAGLAAFGLAESLRAGALLAPLGAAVGLAIISTRSPRIRTLLFGTGAYVAALLISPGLNVLYGTGKGQVGGNLSYVVAGLSLGGGWELAEKTYATSIVRTTDEAQNARFLYRKAFENIREDPRPALGTIGRSYLLFGQQTPEVLRNLAGLGGAGSIAVAALVLLRIFRPLTVPPWGFPVAGAFACGFLFSLPIIYLDGGWRVIAASTPAIFTMLSVLLASPDPRPTGISGYDRLASVGPALMIVSLFAMPIVVRKISRPPETSCVPPGRLIIRHPSREPVVLYESGDATSRKNVPVLTPERMREQLGYSNNPLILPPPPALLDWAYEYSTHQLLTLTAPPALVDVAGPWVWVDPLPAGPPGTLLGVASFGPWEGCGDQNP